MEGREERPTSTEEVAYGRPADADQRERAAGTAPVTEGEPLTGGGGPAAADVPAGHHAPVPQPTATGGAAQTAAPEAPAAGAPAAAYGDASTASGGAGANAGAGPSTPERPDGEDAGMPLLSSGDTDAFERRWQDIQVGFVDEPRACVEQADGLIAEVMKRLAEGFAEERRSLESQWDRGDQVSTEDLRVALQRYRSFFNRLLSTRG